MHPLGADSGLIGRIAVIGGGSLGFAELTDRSSEHLTELFSGMPDGCFRLHDSEVGMADDTKRMSGADRFSAARADHHIHLVSYIQFYLIYYIIAQGK